MIAITNVPTYTQTNGEESTNAVIKNYIPRNDRWADMIYIKCAKNETQFRYIES